MSRRASLAGRATLFAVGTLGAAAQVVLLRELMAAFSGNEFTVGVGIAAWVLCEAAGAATASRLTDAGAARAFPVLAWCSALFSVAAVPIATLARFALGALPGETLGLPAMLVVTAAVMFLPAGTHGALLVSTAAGYAAGRTRPAAVGSAYAWEGVGTAIGGLAVVPLVLLGLPSTAIVALAATPLAAAQIPEKRAWWPALPLALSVAVAVLARPVERWAWNVAWPGWHVRSATNTPYGKVVSLARADQRTVLYDAVPVASVPDADPARTEELAYLPMLAHPAPGRVLVLGSSGRAVAAEIARYPVDAVTVVQLDAGLTHAVAAIEPAGAGRDESRVTNVTADPVVYLGRAAVSFDVIVITDAAPASLAANRLYTAEFYALCRQRLAAGGILALSGPGDGAASAPDVARLLNSRRRTLDAAFAHVALLPADFPLFLASAESLARPETIAARLGSRRLNTVVLDSAYCAALLDEFRREAITNAVTAAATSGVNRGLVPVEVLSSVVRETRRASPGFARWYEKLTAAGPAWWFVLPLGILLLALLAARREVRRPALLAIFTSGLAAAAITTLNIVGYQLRFGSVYSGISLLVAAFMTGTAAGGFLGARFVRAGARRGALLAADACLVAAALAQPLLAVRGPALGFFLVALLAGASLGVQFAAAAGFETDAGIGRGLGRLSALDLAGGFLGGMLASLVLVPAYGVVVTALLVAAVKAASGVGLAIVRTPD